MSQKDKWLTDLQQENERLRAIPRMPTHGQHYDPGAGTCSYCHGVGACPECWGRVGIDALTKEVERLTKECNEYLALLTQSEVALRQHSEARARAERAEAEIRQLHTAKET